ncbi:TniB family NTP-binding protein [Paracoccus seriniphilus]|uniref:TniB protein n=1 Tax=Paracoccus seriniphilus TaxID=184748 RepID=A0A239Q3P0_9RHOB|nr:TniB family NTP-binding protein [Paracoccus seriniphilus]SNT76812.1 TniB protein [Paracoccus seriniphilus]
MDKRGTDPFRVSAELRANYIETARDKILQEHFELLLQHDAKGQPMAKPVTFTSTGETHGIVLVEGPGGGKTSLVHHFLKTHPALQSEEPGHKPWIGVRVPSPATLKSLGLEILRATGYPEVSSKRKEWDIWRLVRFRMQQLGTAVLWIDEAHDLFRAGKAIEDILKMLKSVMQGEGAVIVILTGIDSLWNIASYDDQVKRRYSKVTLPTISASTHEKMLRGIMEKFCKDAGLVPDAGSDIIHRLVYASRSRFGRCIENIIAAIETALRKGDGQLTAQHFAHSWAMQEGVMPGKNVFLSPRWAQIDLTKLHEAA